MMSALPWEDDALAEDAISAWPDLPPNTDVHVTRRDGGQLSVAEIAALGLPVDDPFWILPEVFDAYLAGNGPPVEESGDSIQVDAVDLMMIGSDAPVAQPIRHARAGRAPLPSLDPRKRGPASENLPETVRQAVALIAMPKMSDAQVRGAAAHLLEWYSVEYERRPAISDMVLWWWKAARREIDIRTVWANEIRILWKTDDRPDALDPDIASVNAFYGPLAHHAARAFIRARGHTPDEEVGLELLRSAGFPPPDRDRRGVSASTRFLARGERVR